MFAIFNLSLSCHQETALHNAASQGYIEIVKYLVGKQPHININIQNGDQVSLVILCLLNWLCQFCLYVPDRSQSNKNWTIQTCLKVRQFALFVITL